MIFLWSDFITGNIIFDAFDAFNAFDAFDFVWQDN